MILRDFIFSIIYYQLLLIIYYILFCSASASAFTSAKPVFRLAMRAGSSTASSTASSLTARCQLIRLSVVAMTRLTRSSRRLAQESTFHALSSWISNQLSLVWFSAIIFELWYYDNISIIFSARWSAYGYISPAVPSGAAHHRKGGRGQ